MAKIKILSTLPTAQIFQLGDGSEVLIFGQSRSHIDPSIQIPGETEIETAAWAEIAEKNKALAFMKNGKLYPKGGKSQNESQASDTQSRENGLNPEDLQTGKGTPPNGK